MSLIKSMSLTGNNVFMQKSIIPHLMAFYVGIYLLYFLQLFYTLYLAKEGRINYCSIFKKKKKKKEKTDRQKDRPP